LKNTVGAVADDGGGGDDDDDRVCCSKMHPCLQVPFAAVFVTSIPAQRAR